MDNLVVADIESHMVNPAAGTVKYQVARLCICQGNGLSNGGCCHSVGSSRHLLGADTAGTIHRQTETGTIRAVSQACAAPHISQANMLFRLRHNHGLPFYGGGGLPESIRACDTDSNCHGRVA